MMIFKNCIVIFKSSDNFQNFSVNASLMENAFMSLSASREGMYFIWAPLKRSLVTQSDNKVGPKSAKIHANIKLRHL